MLFHKARNAVAVSMAVVLTLGTTAIASAKEFSDVGNGDWYYNAVSKWSGDDYGVLVGDIDGSFRPNDAMTFGELAQVLSKTFGYSEKAELPESEQGQWYSDAFAETVAAGVMSANFNPTAAVNRQQAVSFMATAFGIDWGSGHTAFLDDAAIAPDCKGYVAAFQEAGYIVGMGDGNFDPTGSFTRAQVMQIMDKILSDIVDTNVSDTTYDNSLLVRAADTTLSNVTVNGNLIIGQGVGDGTVTLKDVTVTGKTILYGGGSNSVIIDGISQLGLVVMNKTFGEPVNLHLVSDNASVTTVQISGTAGAFNGTASGGGAMLTGDFTSAEINVSANAELNLAPGTKVENITVSDDNVTIYVSNGATLAKVVISGDGVQIIGEGTVGEVTVSPDVTGAKVMTVGTQVINNSSSIIVIPNSETGLAGGTTILTATAGATPKPTPSVTNNSSSNDTSWQDSTITVTDKTATVSTFDQLMTATKDSTFKTINIPANTTIESNSADMITINSGVTVNLGQNSGLEISNLTVNGKLNGADGAVIAIWDTLSGSFNNGNQAGSFHEGLTQTYTTLWWGWVTRTDDTSKTGWYPTSGYVDSAVALSDALLDGGDDNATIREIHFLDGSVIPDNTVLNIPSFHVETTGALVIPAGTTVNAQTVVVNGNYKYARAVAGVSLVVNGTLNGTSASSAIYLYNNCSVQLSDGTTFVGPDPEFILSTYRRIVPWTGSVWGPPYLQNSSTGSTSCYATANVIGDVDYLASTYPELGGIHIYGDRFAFDASNMNTTSGAALTETSVPILIHGNQTFNNGNDSTLMQPAKIASNYTLTIGSGTKVIMVSDGYPAISIVGTDVTSQIIVEPGAIVTDDYGDTYGPYFTGMYVWESGSEQWKIAAYADNNGSTDLYVSLDAFCSTYGLEAYYMGGGVYEIVDANGNTADSALGSGTLTLTSSGASMPVDSFMLSVSGYSGTVFSAAQLTAALQVFGMI